MTSDQVRPVIECFCQILSFYGFSPVDSDTFQSAKFDRPEATEPLWRLLFEMMHFDPHRTQQEQSRQIFEQTSKDQLVSTIKADLYQRGYVYDHVLYLDDQMEKGSRALLVCLGWLIYHLKFIERCLAECLRSIPPQDQKQQPKKKKTTTKTSVSQINQAIHSNGKVRSHLDDLRKQLIANDGSLEQQSMSAFDVRLCQHPEFLSQCLMELESEHQRLIALLFWYKNENVFWKWMESVLDQPASAVQPKPQTTVSPITRQRLDAEREKFNATIDTLDDALVRLEQLWIANDDHRSIEDDFTAIIASIDGQISSLFNQLLNPASDIPSN